jgi:arylsulfatase A-like enzyme
MTRTLSISALAVLLITSCSGKVPLNIVVVSACSVRDISETTTPKICKWSRGGVQFDNAVAIKPWENFGTLSAGILSPKFVKSKNYLPLGIGERNFRYYIPPATQTNEGGDIEWFFPSKSILHYEDSLAVLKRELTSKIRMPFFTVVHLKYMHYPYYDDVNLNDSDWARLSAPSRALLNRYLQGKNLPDAKLPFFEILFNDFDRLKHRFGLKKLVHSAAGIVSDVTRDAKWRKSAGYEGDLALLKELYSLKLRHFDELASTVLNLFDDKKLAENTVVVFMGDHGEAFMEHGVIGHSVNVYEEMLRFPMVVKFPGAEKTIHVESQFGHLELAQLLAKVISGEVRSDNFQAEVVKMSPEYFLSRNCANTMRSVRFKSEWKFIKNLGGGGDELYDLKGDPKELNNLIKKNPDIAWKLEEYLLDHQGELKQNNKAELATKVCLDGA